MESTPLPAFARGAELKRDPRLPPEVIGRIRHRIERFPDGRLWSCGPVDDRSQSYARLWERSAAIAGGLSLRGAVGGRPVVVLAKDALDFVPVFWACLRAGALPVPLASAAGDPLRERREAALQGALSRLDRPLILADAYHAALAETFSERGGADVLTLAEAEAAAPIAEEAPPGRTTCLVPTSGSTGQVKLAALGHETLLHRPMLNPPEVPSEGGAFLTVFPFDGITGLSMAFLTHRFLVHMPPASFAGHPTRLLAALERHQVRSLALTSSLAALLLAETEGSTGHWDLSSLGAVSFGAETVVPTVMRRFLALLARNGAASARCIAGYGATETGPLVVGADIAALAPDAEATPLGRVMNGVTLRIVDEDGQIVSEGEPGAVEAYCPQVVFSGYWGDEAATRAAFTPDGWWRTGDRGRLDEGGVTLLGRTKDVIVIHGRKHSLAEIDATLRATAGIEGPAYACAVHDPDEDAERLAIVFVPPASAGPGEIATTAETIHGTVARRFGLAPAAILAAEPGDIPLAGVGKIRRFELGQRVREGRCGRVVRRAAPIRELGREPAPDARLAGIWRDVLGLSGPLDPHGHFFELGGDSLRSLALATRIQETFGLWIGAEAFFAEPTLATLARLLAEAAPGAGRPGAQDGVPWPLPDDLRAKQLSLFELWGGTRPTRDRLVAGLNTDGTEPPLFWVFQIEFEFRQLAGQLGPERPLYGLRSGAGIFAYTEDEIQTLALRYVHEISETCPEGPFFIGGNCQGAIIALAVAQHLLRRGRHIPLLVLMEWGFPLQPYGGRVLLVYGRDSLQGNPYRRYPDPELVWRRAFLDHRSAEILGAHGTFFREGSHVETLGRVLREHLDAAILEPPLVLTRDACPTRLSAEAPPQAMACKETRTVSVEVVNAGRFAWDVEPFGLALRAVWLDPSDTVIEIVTARAKLPPMMPSERATVHLPITAPDRHGRLTLVIDVIDAGDTWRALSPRAALRLPVRVMESKI